MWHDGIVMLLLLSSLYTYSPSFDYQGSGTGSDAYDIDYGIHSLLPDFMDYQSVIPTVQYSPDTEHIMLLVKQATSRCVITQSRFSPPFSDMDTRPPFTTSHTPYEQSYSALETEVCRFISVVSLYLLFIFCGSWHELWNTACMGGGVLCYATVGPVVRPQTGGGGLGEGPTSWSVNVVESERRRDAFIF